MRPLLNEACETVTVFNFRRNFDYDKYGQFSDQDLKEANLRDQEKITAVDCQNYLQETLDKNLPVKINIIDIFRFNDEEKQIIGECLINSLDGQRTLLSKSPNIQSIKAMDSTSYVDNYPDSYLITFTDGMGVIIALNPISCAFEVVGQMLKIEMDYNLNSPDYQSDSARRDFQRTLKTSRIEGGNWVDSITIFEKDGGYLDQNLEILQTFTDRDNNEVQICDLSTFMDFLKRSKSNPLISDFLNYVKLQNNHLGNSIGHSPEVAESFFSFSKIMKIEELIEIFKLLPADPEIYGQLISLVLRYHDYDKSDRDQFRDPVTTLRSGWADCDDFATINYFWAYLHGFNPNMCAIQNPRDGAGHVFVWYRDDNGKFVTMDNSIIAIGQAENMEDYMKGNQSLGDKWEVVYDGPV